MRGLVPYARGEQRWLWLGGAAALGVVASRLALPWPLHAVVNLWVEGSIPAPLAALGVGSDPALVLGALFFVLIVALGFSDHVERLFFARFSNGIAKALRQDAVAAALRIEPNQRAAHAGTVLSRTFSESVRLKNGLRSFLVHVATNGLVFAGITVIIFWIDAGLGVIFAAAGIALATVAFTASARLFRRNLRRGKREDALADQIHAALQGNSAVTGDAELPLDLDLGASVGGQASQTRIQGIATWTAHMIFGAAVLLAVYLGSNAVARGAIPVADLVLVLMYALMMRGSAVRLTRQASRTGRILGAAQRLLDLAAASRPTKRRRSTRRARKLASGPALARSGSDSTPKAREVSPVTDTFRILFSGYAPVHFVCFQPIYQRLQGVPGIEIYVSGGMRTRGPHGWIYDEQALYRRFDLPRASVLSVDDIRQQDFDAVFGGNTKMILPRSTRMRIQIFHGISFRNKAIRPANMSCDHYFIVGPYMRRRFAESGLLGPDDARAIPIGFMKTDRLLDGSLDRDALLRKLGLEGDRPVVLYAPTGQKQNSLETMGQAVIERIAKSGRYDLLIKPHDHPKNQERDWFQDLQCFEDAHCRLIRDPDVIPFLHLADVLITDASSVASEYALLDRPMIFLDTPKLIGKALRAADSMVDLDTWGRKGGVIVERPDDVLGALERSLDAPLELSCIRQQMASDLFYNPGHATDAAIAWLQANLLGDLRQPRSATA